MIFLGNAVIFLICLLLSAYLSYRKGIWLALLNIVGLLCAYVTSFLLSPSLVGLLRPLVGGEALSYLVTLTGIFLVVVSLVTLLPPMFFPRIREQSEKEKIAGAILGLVLGFIYSAILIWFSAVARSAIRPPSSLVKPDLFSRFSSSVVSHMAGAGMALLDSDKQKSEVTAGLLSAPQVVSSSIAELAKSPEMRDIWRDGEFQQLMVERDIQGMLAHEKFVHLAKKDTVKMLLEAGKPAEVSDESAKQFLAEKMSFLWRRLRLLRGDERVVAILDDPEVKELIGKQNPVLLLANSKIRTLIDIVLEEEEGESMAQLDENMEKNANRGSDIDNSKPLVIYRWESEDGTIQYTDLENTPIAKRESAEKIIRQDSQIQLQREDSYD